MNGLPDFNLSQILATIYRKKKIVLCVALVVFLWSVYLATVLSNVYRSSSLILISPQSLPSNFVTSTITRDLNDRLQAIIQEILSRTQLEKIVREFDLYSSTSGMVEDRIEKLRKTIKIEARRNNVFQLSFESENPETAQKVTNRIASLFIEQHVQVREQQAIGTKTFMAAETERLRKELEDQEIVVNRFRAAHRYELPDQLDSNLRSLEQLRREAEAADQRLTALQERKRILEAQTVESDIFSLDIPIGMPLGSVEGASQINSLQLKRRELEVLSKRYSAKHPDVVRLKREIESLAEEKQDVTPDKSGMSTTKPSGNPLKKVLQTQIRDIDAEITVLRSQRDQIRSQINTLQARVDAAPIRTIELSKISRGYEIILRKYQDLLAKSLESELSENMEKKQKGEQFQILDAANFPLKPIRPNRLMILAIGLMAGLAAGCGLTLVLDTMDTSFKKTDDLNGFNVPLLATIPALRTRSSVLEERRWESVLMLTSVGALVVGVVILRTFGPMYF